MTAGLISKAARDQVVAYSPGTNPSEKINFVLLGTIAAMGFVLSMID